MSWDKNLSGEHLNIASSAAKRLRVMAGPGTGKSFAMQRRIARLIEEDNVDPRRILAVTFTRTAARDLAKDLRSMDVPGAENITAQTVHAFCFSLLMQNSVLSFADRTPRGLLTFNHMGVYGFEIQPMLADLMLKSNFGKKRKMSERIRAFEAAWARLQHDRPDWPKETIDRQFHEALSQWLKFHEGMLIGELVPITLKYLKSNPASQALQKFDHIVVDEYQDLNKAEQELIQVLAKGKNLSVVGDIDQSIYSFRYAHPSGILEFANYHKDVVDFNLTECRRCRAEIVSLADNLIQKNYPSNSAKRLLPTSHQSDVAIIHLLQWQTLTEEAEGIASYIHHLTTKETYKPGDILVLSPRRLIANEIKSQLAKRDSKIPIHSFYNDKLLEPPEVQEAISKLQLLNNLQDRVSLRFWLGKGSDTWQSREYENLRKLCEKSGKTPVDTLMEIRNDNAKSKRFSKLLTRFNALLSEIERLKALDLTKLFDDLFPVGTDWGDPIRELVIGKIESVQDPEGLLDLLITEITQPEMPADGEFVRVMSLHKSKGLTSRVTIVVGCIEGLIPFLDDDLSPEEQEESLREQRRLFYVALTRAKEVLVVSSALEIPAAIAHQIGAKVRRGKTSASQFLTELGPDAPDGILGSAWVSRGFV
jgi:DNA helicase II / ATP-dependent DNA helicase PcrA